MQQTRCLKKMAMILSLVLYHSYIFPRATDVTHTGSPRIPSSCRHASFLKTLTPTFLSHLLLHYLSRMAWSLRTIVGTDSAVVRGCPKGLRSQAMREVRSEYSRGVPTFRDLALAPLLLARELPPAALPHSRPLLTSHNQQHAPSCSVWCLCRCRVLMLTKASPKDVLNPRALRDGRRDHLSLLCLRPHPLSLCQRPVARAG